MVLIIFLDKLTYPRCDKLPESAQSVSESVVQLSGAGVDLIGADVAHE